MNIIAYNQKLYIKKEPLDGMPRNNALLYILQIFLWDIKLRVIKQSVGYEFLYTLLTGKKLHKRLFYIPFYSNYVSNWDL